jgi:hypothetical protein
MPNEITLPAGTEFVSVAEIPELIATALHPNASQPTVSYFTKMARPGATGKTAEWDGWEIDDNDCKLLVDICGYIPPVGAAQEEVQLYLDKANSAGLNWELGVVWRNPDSSWLVAEKEHGLAIYNAIRFGYLEALSPVSRLPADENVSGAVVAVEKLEHYIQQFGIGLRWDAGESELSKVYETEKTIRGISKQKVINAFEGMHFDRDKWGKYLGSPPKWLEMCRIARGSKGRKVSATWNPVLIAAALYDKGIKIRKLDAVFVGLSEWRDEWDEASSTFRD